MLRNRAALVAATLAMLVTCGSAQADVTQDFGVRLADVNATTGAFSFVIQSRTSGPGGAVPASVTRQQLRLPAGIELRPQFLKSPFVCDVAKLRQSANPADCKSAQVGTGRIMADLRPFYTTSVPFNVYVFLARGSDSSAVSSLAALMLPDGSSPVVQQNPTVRDVRPVLQGNIYEDPGDQFGYVLDLPVQVSAPLQVSLLDVQLTVSGLSTKGRVRSCVKHKKGKCVKNKSRKATIFWLTQPICPGSRKLSFQSIYTYDRGAELTRNASIGCPRFKT